VPDGGPLAGGAYMCATVGECRTAKLAVREQDHTEFGQLWPCRGNPSFAACVRLQRTVKVWASIAMSVEVGDGNIGGNAGADRWFLDRTDTARGQYHLGRDSAGAKGR
jgi:hypothetical protein